MERAGPEHFNRTPSSPEAASTPLSIQEAKSILGEKNVFGPEEFSLGFETETPPIPFRKELLKEMPNSRLILTVEYIQEFGKEAVPATPQEIKKLFPTLFDGMRELDEAPVFCETTARPSWALVSKTRLPGTSGMNLLQQTQVVAEAIQGFLSKEHVFTERQQQVYERALQQYEERRGSLQELLASDPLAAQGAIYDLLLNRLTVQQLPEAMQLAIAVDGPILDLDEGMSRHNRVQVQYPASLNHPYGVIASPGVFRHPQAGLNFMYNWRGANLSESSPGRVLALR